MLYLNLPIFLGVLNVQQNLKENEDCFFFLIQRIASINLQQENLPVFCWAEIND